MALHNVYGAAMRAIMKKKRHNGWLAVGLHADRVDLVHVNRAAIGRPQVTLCESYGKAESDAATLSRLSKQLRLDRYRCTTLLRRESYQLQQIDAPNVPAAELKAAVRWRVKDIISYPVEDAIVEVLEVPHDAEAPAPEQALFAVTAPSSGVDRVIQPFHDARVPLDVVDIPELAQRNVAALYETDAAGVLMLGFHSDDTLLTFTRGAELYSARRIDISLPQVLHEDALQRSGHLQRLALEMRRSIEHLRHKYHYVPHVRVLLAPLPQESGLEQYLASALNLPVETVDVSAVLDVAAVPELKRAESQARYFGCIGAALRDEHRVAA